MNNSRIYIGLACSFVGILVAEPVFAQSNRDDAAIRQEQADLRLELATLEQESRSIKHRLKNLDQIIEVQKELNRVLAQLEETKSSTNRDRTARLQSRVEPLERHLDDLREALEAKEELDEQISDWKNLVQQLRELKDIDEATQSAQYLAASIDALNRLREIRERLDSLDSDDENSTRILFQQEASELRKRIDADEELVDLVITILEALENDGQEELEDLLPELTELRHELESRKGVKPRNESRLAIGQSGQLKSGEYFVTQSWSQEENFRRPYFVNIPNQPANKKLPVLIFLHGNGGNAQGAMRGFLRGRKKIASQFILVFAQGYRESWNIVSERSKADDLGFIEAIVSKVASYENVDSNNFTIMGASNGAALVNQIAIESKLSNIRNYISGVSQLNVWQYDGKNFKAKGNDNNYRKSATPATGKRLLNISGAKDNLVPYQGGTSRGIPAKNGKLGFVAAEKSTFLWARQMGYSGEQLTQPSDIFENVEVFRYLDGDVIHFKVTNEGHGATHGIGEKLLLDFLVGGKKNTDAK
ncbi:hypothetical protein N9007_00375 [bacterium]|nr:hypothetical protein [bacterium]